MIKKLEAIWNGMINTKNHDVRHNFSGSVAYKQQKAE